MKIFPVFHLPKLCNELIVTYFVYVFHVVTLANLLIPIYQLYFQISNCNVFVYVTFAYFFKYLL